MTPEELVELARRARERAHAPYSRFRVGAALWASGGSVHTGCNVEVASYGLTCCAERVAVFAAVAAGERDFRSIAVVSPGGAAPCGACRQVLREFGPDLVIPLAAETGPVRTTSLAALLPDPFGPSDLTGE